MDNDKVFVSSQPLLIRLLDYFGDSQSLWHHLEENNLLDWKKSELTQNQNRVLSTMIPNKKMKLLDLWNLFLEKYPDITLSRSGHYRIVSKLNGLGFVIKNQGGIYQRIETKEYKDILNGDITKSSFQKIIS